MKIKVMFFSYLILLSIPTASGCWDNVHCCGDSNCPLSKKDLIEKIPLLPKLLDDGEKFNDTSNVVKEYNMLIDQFNNEMIKAFDKLSNSDFIKINNFLKTNKWSPAGIDEYEQYQFKMANAAMKLQKQTPEGKACTREMFRNEYTFLFELVKEKIGKKDTEFLNLLISLLKKNKNTKTLIINLNMFSKNISQFSQKNRDILAMFLFEQFVDCMFPNFQSFQNNLKNKK